jgi:hypothetical protein
VFIDTNLFICFLGQNPEFFTVVSTLWEAAEWVSLFAYTGDNTVAEKTS